MCEVHGGGGSSSLEGHVVGCVVESRMPVKGPAADVLAWVRVPVPMNLYGSVPEHT